MSSAYITSGMYERHNIKIRRKYAARIHALTSGDRRDDKLIMAPIGLSAVVSQLSLPKVLSALYT